MYFEHDDKTHRYPSSNHTHKNKHDRIES